MPLNGPRPEWLTFDCYGTLIQWDEGLVAAFDRILSRAGAKIEAARLISVYDRHEHELEGHVPHLTFKDVSARSLRLAMAELALPAHPDDAEILTSSIGKMPPFPEAVATLSQLKSAGFHLAVISNTDDDIIARSIAQLGGVIDRVITAQQAQADKPSESIFRHAWNTLGVGREGLVHICASPHLDLAAARDFGFRSIWIDRGTARRPLPDYSPNQTAPSLDLVPQILTSVGWM
jgi:2-haloacid dehalogenase/putative hydrolase of the HAD superfamily